MGIIISEFIQKKVSHKIKLRDFFIILTKLSRCIDTLNKKDII